MLISARITINSALELTEFVIVCLINYIFSDTYYSRSVTLPKIDIKAECCKRTTKFNDGPFICRLQSGCPMIERLRRMKRLDDSHVLDFVNWKMNFAVHSPPSSLIQCRRN